MSNEPKMKNRHARRKRMERLFFLQWFTPVLSLVSSISGVALLFERMPVIVIQAITLTAIILNSVSILLNLYINPPKKDPSLELWDKCKPGQIK